MKSLPTIALAACALLLAACDTLPGSHPESGKPADSNPASQQPAAPARPSQATPAVQPAPVAPAPVPNADQIALKEGTALYNNGEYNKAIARLSAPEIGTGSKATQIAALKYLAFSYCVTNRQALCRQQFEKAFKLDPAFDLAPGENGHPLWTPAFKKEKDKARREEKDKAKKAK